MLTRDETTIWKKLNEGQTAEEILTDWAADLTLQADQKDKSEVFCCLSYNSGQWQWLSDRVCFFLDEELSLHWGVLAHIWAEKQVLSQSLSKSLIKAAKKTSTQHWLMGLSIAPGAERELSKLKTDELANLKLSLKQRKEDLVERIHFYKDQLLINEEKKILDKLFLFYPEDPVWIEYKKEFDKRWAAESLSQRGAPSVFVQERTQTFFDLNEQEFIDQLAQYTRKYTLERPEASYDFAIMFVFIGAYSEALQCLEQISDDQKVSWLKIELLLKDHRYVEALDQSEQLERRLAEDPEAAFSSCYLKAQALYGLGDQLTATELLEGLVSVRSDYRSAEILLRRWKDGAK